MRAQASGGAICLAPGWNQLTSLQNAHLSGVHLRLLGYGDDGPTLEIFSYKPIGRVRTCHPRTSAGSVTSHLRWMM